MPSFTASLSMRSSLRPASTSRSKWQTVRDLDYLILTPPLADARTEAEVSARGVAVPEIEGDWNTLPGELVAFPDPVRALSPIDRLEGFRPETERLYHRARVTAKDSARKLPGWAYHIADRLVGQRLQGGCWRKRSPSRQCQRLSRGQGPQWQEEQQEMSEVRAARRKTCTRV
jgi:hypothetical protein